MKDKVKKTLKEYLTVTVGTLLVGMGVYFFKFPNNFSTGGVSGISILLAALFDKLTPGLTMLIINVALLVVGFIFIGRDFCLKTVYSSLLLSAFTYGMEYICPMSAPFTGDKLLELVFAIFLPAFGSAILFNNGASTGGTDVVAALIKKYAKVGNISFALLIADMIIVLASVFVFDVATWLYCVLGLVSKCLLVNIVIEGMNTSKYFTIITENPDPISGYIKNVLHKGATLAKHCEGVFSNDDKTIIMTVLRRPQARLLRDYIKEADPGAFVIINNTSDIIGKGFRETV